ncbi:MAG TPA: DUF2145 domain-containing protein [Hellea balneolensis]|uniref:DUF2145 domain-containing protein n=1 Tax=Hellea balneolensis TaxID=287478 RepID=A0A7C5M270_9PROT|nr:DUF2145 domain-containing protein [Hellea balneolensis]
MSLRLKILFIVLVVLAAGAGFMRYLDLEYKSLIASTQKGNPLFERSVLEDYGHQIRNHLLENNIEVAILSRSGQPRARLPEGILFTHSAFFVKEGDDYDVYNLYHGEDNRLISSLVTDKAADFLKLTRERDVGILVPKTEVQTALKAFIKSPAYRRVHQTNYSLISNPFDLRYQNCNEFLLDALGAFAWKTTDRTKIKAQLKTFFDPTIIKAGFVRRKIAPLVDERLRMADHGREIKTATRLDLQEFLEHEHMLDTAYVLKFKPVHTKEN